MKSKYHFTHHEVLIRMFTLADNFDESRHPQEGSKKQNLSLSFLLVYLEKITHNLLSFLLSNDLHHLVPASNDITMMTDQKTQAKANIG